MSLSQTMQTIKERTGQMIGFVSAAVTRIFGLNDDDYPATGVQPFEGEPSDER
jgi:hypothetical protein